MDKETWDDCEKRIKEVLKNNLKMDGIEIERAHRLGRKDHNKQRPRTIIFKLSSWKQKQRILKNRNKQDMLECLLMKVSVTRRTK